MPEKGRESSQDDRVASMAIQNDILRPCALSFPSASRPSDYNRDH